MPSSCEQTRLAALNALTILDTPAEARFDRLTRLATLAIKVPIALISLVDEHRQWFKSHCGLDETQTPRSIAFCDHAVRMGGMLVVEDASLDERFRDNPLVLDGPKIRFYAGQCVFSDGQAVGTLCVIDSVARTMTDADRQSLRDLAALAEVELNETKQTTSRLLAEQALQALNAELEDRVTSRTVELQHRLDELAAEVARRQGAELALRDSEAWNSTIIGSSYSGFVATGSDGILIEWNESAERIFGWTREQAVGKRIADLIVPPELRPAHEKQMRALRDTGTSSLVDKKLELPAMTASGRRITLGITISAYDWKGQRCFGAFMTDISERIETQQRLEEQQELLDAVLESIDVAVVASDAVGNLTVFNRVARNIHGLDMKRIAPSEWPNYFSLHHGDGHTAMVMDEVPLVRALKGDVVLDQAMSVVVAGRSTRTLLASGRPLRTPGGRMLGAVVAMKDVTELNSSREKLAASEARLRTITDNVPVLIACLDASRRYIFANAVHNDWIGLRPDSLIGKTLEQAYGADCHKMQLDALELAWKGHASQCEHDIVRKKQKRIMHSTFLPQLRDGRVDGVYVLTTDATASRMHERSLHALAHTDALTGLANRLEFQQALDSTARRSRHGDRACALLYMDVDRFKQINDCHGHGVGDEVLVELAQRLRGATRGTDLVARLAGDEFTVLLDDLGCSADLSCVIEKILEAVRRPFALENRELMVTLSVGAAYASGTTFGPKALMEVADKALYAAKEAGRNRHAILQFNDAACAGAQAA